MTQSQPAEGSVDLNQMRTLGDIARYHKDHRPDAIALSFDGRDTSYTAFDRQTNQIARALLADGVKEGDRIVYTGKNSGRYFQLLFGAGKMGAVMLPMGWRLAPAEMAYILEDGRNQFVFTDTPTSGAVREAIKLTELDIQVMQLDRTDLDEFAHWRDRQAGEALTGQISPDQTAIQIYTSGTTGRPKGVMLSHDNVLTGWRAADLRGWAWNKWGPDDVSLIAMPVGHIGGTGWGITGLLYGARSVLLPEFDPGRVLQIIAQERISKMFMVPAALQILARHPQASEVNFESLKYILYGASPMPLDLLRECIDVFGCGFCQQYGMTETSGPIVYLPPEDHDPVGNQRMRAAGLPMPEVELRIVDDEGQATAARTTGEIVIRSPMNMQGYWRNEQATQETISRDGWLRTGDAGYLDEDGYLFIEGRKKEMIISGGENIYPAEVENAMFGHPDVAEVAVFGVPHAKWGESVAASVVLKSEGVGDVDSILGFAKSQIASFKLPKSIDFVSALPRNASGKVLKHKLRESRMKQAKRVGSG